MKINTLFYYIAYILVIVCQCSVCIATPLYKYRDANGIWHYSNIQPSIPKRKIDHHDQRERIVITEKNNNNDISLYVKNNYFCSVEVELDFLENKNLITIPSLPARYIVPPQSEYKAIEVKPIDASKPWSYKYKYSYVIGSPHAKHDLNFRYHFPFPKGYSFFISQAFHGKYSHHEPSNMFAVDIPMPIGTPICAARSGVVIDIVQNFFKHGTNKKYLQRGNFIRILHEDGTMAIYVHLNPQSAKVHIGTIVKTGQIIAESGNTGYSSGPHLHFAIQKNNGMQLISLPFVFKGENGSAIKPKTLTRVEH
ncbi:MAG: M23 family metallopeptidase [Desulfobacterales bacterium]|nr:M23 family metallopeptidase [Desulfobacterales bacterium]